MISPLRWTCLASALALLGAAPACVATPEPETPARGFVSTQPARTWEQGLIVGNGTIGANLLSRPLDERIVLSHERLFLPEGEPLEPPLLAPHLGEIRGLIERGEYTRATELAFELSEQTSFMYPDRFVPAFDLCIRSEAEGEVVDYLRSVDFRSGEAAVRWSDARGRFSRRMFVSRADGVAVLSITGPGPGTVGCRLWLEPRTPSEELEAETLERSRQVFERDVVDLQTRAEGTFLTFRNRFARAYEGSIQGVEAAAHVSAPGGEVVAEGGSLVVTGADEVLLLLDLEVLRDAGRSQLEQLEERLVYLPADYARLRARHAQVHGELFERMRLDLGGGADHALPTETLLARSTNAALDRALLEKVFDAGRYNILSCTGELPPVLQGVWGGTYVPGWASDYTHNGNVPSAIASMLMGNMPELMLAYTSYIESIVPGMRANAERIFGARGVVLPSRTSTHGYNNAFAPRFAGAFWVAGAAWASHFFYDYWLYTGDREFLAEHALPFMEEAAVFFEDYLVEGPDGLYVFSPTQSPENTPGNTDSQGTFNATMDVAAAKELLRSCIAASRELGVNAERIPVWERMLTKMPPYQIGPDGAVKEWLTPRLEDRHGHRHSSHLYALYDGMPEEIERDPELRAAFRRLIEIKLDRHWGEGSSGFMSFGLVQLGQAAASLGEGELAYRCLVELVNRYWLHNLASMHNHRSLFNMDISGGLPAVVIKMLVASDPGRIRLLPALPAAWPTGTIEGVLCRGQVEVERLRWDGQTVEVELRSREPQTIVLEVPFPIREAAVERGRAALAGTGQASQRRVTLPAGALVRLRIAG